MLGYGITLPDGISDKLNDVGYYLGNRVDGLMTSLAAIDEALQAAPLDSMAVKIDKLEVSYSQHLTLLKQEGSRMLHELSRLLEIPLAYDKYLQKDPNVDVKVNRRYNFTSYW